jgi:hypothetical protein
MGKPCGSSGDENPAFSKAHPSGSTCRYVKTINRLPRGNTRVRLASLSPEKQDVEAELRAPGVLMLTAHEDDKTCASARYGQATMFERGHPSKG